MDVLHDKCNWIQIWNEVRNLLKVEMINEIGKGLISTVVITWFLFQTGEVAMGVYQWYLDRRESREQKIREEVMEKVRKAEQERVHRMLEDVRKSVGKGASAEESFQAMESACSYSRNQ